MSGDVDPAQAASPVAGEAPAVAGPWRARLFRPHARAAAEGKLGRPPEARVTNIELFFDLVFVFGVTQLSHALLDTLSWQGAAQTAVMLGALWWLWIYTSWATNWLDPERAVVRLLLILMMMGGLVLAASIPRAFGTGSSAAVFAAAYLAMQAGRTLAVAWAWRGVDASRMRNFVRIAFYFLLSAPFWIAGVLSGPEARLAFWAAALAIELLGPAVAFATPGLGRSRLVDWDIDAGHMAERCGLFIIIALGEAVLVTGATYAGLPPSGALNAAFALSFLGSATMWWIYFDTGAKRGGEALEETPETGRIARSAYTYLHLPIVAGLVVTAVGDEMLLAHPLEPVHTETLWTLFGGPWLFVAGNMLFKWSTAGRRLPPLSHAAGMILLALLAAAAWWWHWPSLVAALAATLALVATAAWEWFSLNGGWRRWAPGLGRLGAPEAAPSGHG